MYQPLPPRHHASSAAGEEEEGRRRRRRKMFSLRAGLAMGAASIVGALVLAAYGGASASASLAAAPMRTTSMSMSMSMPTAARGGRAAQRPPTLCRSSSYNAGIPLDPTLIPGDLPYNAKKEGFTNALERAIRNKDMPAVRILEQAREQVRQQTADGGSMGKWDEIRAQNAVKKRRELMDLSIKRRENEDRLVRELKSKGDFSLNNRDAEGLTIDIQKIIAQQAQTLEKALKDTARGPRLISMRSEIDPMPWWDSMRKYTLQMRTAQYLKELMGYNKVLVLMEDPHELTGESIDGLIIDRFGNPEADYQGADLILCFGVTVDEVAKTPRIIKASQATQSNGDVIVMGGNWGAPSDYEAKFVRQTLKEHFSGGLQAISFIMDPVKLVPNVGGEPYPLPQWLIDAGYKAAGNVAITGNSGTGKSSLNNALRGLKPRDDGAAKVGVKETTLEPEGYPFEPAGPEMKLWDLPGAGTPKFPLESYMRTMGIKYFDEVIIASASRFTETDLDLMDELRMHGVPFIALRTKVDLEIRNAAQDSGASEAELIRGIREDIKKNSLLPDDRIYMVSARRPDDFDFPRLRQYIIDSLHRGRDVKLAKAFNRELEIREIWNAVC